MIKPQYDLSYNRSKAIPNWTSWHLDSSWIGSTPRQDDFRADTTLPAGWYQVGSTSYSGSGYDRGHMCPSGDRTSSVANNSATFLMTNMIPQAPTNNQTIWANFESYCRTLVTAGNELYIISGGSGVSGFINNGNVTVPTTTWKVVVVLPNGTNDVARVTGSTRTIAISLPNTNNVVSDWRQYRTTVDAVEGATGYDFFSNVDPAIQAQIESVVDTQFVEDSNIFLDNYAQKEVEFEALINPIKETK
jgi:endonuclease G